MTIDHPFACTHAVHAVEEAEKDALAARQRVILCPPLPNRKAHFAR